MLILGSSLKTMKHLFTVPKNHFDDFYDETRFALTWQICWMFTLVIDVVTGLSVFANDTFYPFYVGVLSLVIRRVDLHAYLWEV